MLSYKSLKKERCLEIEMLVESLFHSTCELSPNLDQLVQQLKGVIEYSPSRQGALDAKVTQLATVPFTKIEGSTVAFKIEVEECMEIGRQRFAIAKGLGRVLLHMQYFNESVWSQQAGVFYLGDSYLLDEEAEYFAYALLMPRQAFEQIISEEVQSQAFSVDSGKIAQLFQVRNQNVLTRGMILGLIHKK